MSSDQGAEGLPSNAAEILTEVTGIAAAPGTLAERAEALLAQLRRVVPHDAGAMILLPRSQDGQVYLARWGYDERVCGYLDSPVMMGDLELVGLRRLRRPLRIREIPDLPRLPGWAEYLEPAGFRDGLGTGLFTPGGRCIGMLALHTETPDWISEATRSLIGRLAAPMAVAVDPLGSLATIAGMVQRATAGIVVAPSGGVVALPGLPDHRLLAPGSRVLAAACEQLAPGGLYASFLAPLPAAQDEDTEDDEDEGAQTHARITVLAAPHDVRLFATAAVLVSPAGDLHGLSRRELQVLGLLVTGASNARIGQALRISARTVAVHLDHVRAKLAAPSRTAAAARALRLGLFVPAALLGVRSGHAGQDGSTGRGRRGGRAAAVSTGTPQPARPQHRLAGIALTPDTLSPHRAT